MKYSEFADTYMIVHFKDGLLGKSQETRVAVVPKQANEGDPDSEQDAVLMLWIDCEMTIPHGVSFKGTMMWTRLDKPATRENVTGRSKNEVVMRLLQDYFDLDMAA